MQEYHKIKNIYERDHETKKIIDGKYTDKTLEFLKDNIWEFTEKVDGTNIRIIWDGHKVSFAGRTDKAQIPVEFVKTNPLSKIAQKEYVMEGIVGRTKIELNDRCSNRAIVKIKVKDFS